jgi:DNA ligase-3
VEDAWRRCPNKILAEIKYDGERIQIHKDGTKYSTFSRNLKAVSKHKVGFHSHFYLFIC